MSLNPTLRVPLLAVALSILAWFGAAAPGCGSASDQTPVRAAEDAGPMTVVATIGMVGDAVRAVAGDRADVQVLIGPGLDPHLYRPTRTDVGILLEADAIFYNGLLLEGKLVDSLIRAANAGTPVFAVTESVDPELLLSPDDFEGHEDPHLWMDPSAWASVVAVVRDRLIELDPEGSDAYTDNAARYEARLAELHAYSERVLSTVPAESRVLITAHDAFNYFGHRYGFEVVGIQGISTVSEAGIRDIENIADMIVERSVGAVFIESTVSDRNVESILDNARARGHEVVIGGELFSDAMGDAGTYEGTYIGMIDHNVTAITRALGGDAPERGMAGRLGG